MTEAPIIEHKLTYRPFEKRDEEGILRLWEEESGWGAITMEQFNRWVLQSPYGESYLVVAVDDENIVRGQLFLSPSRVLANGRVLKSIKVSAPILHGSLRQSNLRSAEHPAINLIRKGMEVARADGYQLLYSFPAYGWIPVIQFIGRVVPYPCETKGYDCFAVSLEDESTLKLSDTKYTVSLIENYTEEHSALWEQCVQHFPINCAVSREHRGLNRLTGNAFRLETRLTSDNTLIGFMSIKKDGLMLDLIAKNQEDLKTTFEQTIRACHLHTPNNPDLPFKKLKGMMTPETEKLLEAVPFVKEDFHFAFGYFLLDTNLDPETLKISRWYLTPLG
jgi:hypothetical protein